MLVDELIRQSGLRRAVFQWASMGSVALCTVLWMRGASFDQDERGNAERRALFVGLWAPTLWMVGQSLPPTRRTRRFRKR